MDLRLKSGFFGLFASVLLMIGGDAEATPVFLVAAGECNDTPARCVATNGIVTSTAYGPTLIEASDPFWADYTSAFNSWNASLPLAQQWTLNLLSLGSLSDSALIVVDLYRAYVNEGCGLTCGGAEIDILYEPGDGDPSVIGLDGIGALDAVWTQSVFTNQKRNPSLPGNPYLDNAPDTVNPDLGPPAYPFQYTDSSFYDKPGRDAYALWLAEAFLSQIDYTTRTVTLYAGVEWGFQVVPEPSTLFLVAVSTLLIIGFQLRRKRRA